MNDLCAPVHTVSARKEEAFPAMLRTDGVRTLAFEDGRRP